MILVNVAVRIQEQQMNHDAALLLQLSAVVFKRASDWGLLQTRYVFSCSLYHDTKGVKAYPAVYGIWYIYFRYRAPTTYHTYYS